MSMLAERRTKKKWCLNPNGKEWSNDDNKFGQRMLEKMGWKKGCGLGVNLQGMKEHVKVSAKNDTKGLGCKNNSDNEWIHHQQSFENLLSELASSTSEEISPPGTSETKPVSLEEKSKKSRVRVHYQKFTRGKDVARYSANDLACIFGKKCSSLDMQYSCNVTAINISKADSEDSMTSGKHTMEQSVNSCTEKTTDDCLPSLVPTHRAEDQPVLHIHEDKGVKEKQKNILKEISNVKEDCVPDLDTVEECKNEIHDNSATHSSSESLEKVRSKKKRKRVKDSENNEVVFTETMILSQQDEVNECDTVLHEVEEKNKKRKKKKKDKKKKVKVEDETGKQCSEVMMEELTEDETGKECSEVMMEELIENVNKDIENGGMISVADTTNSEIKMKNTYRLCQTDISEAHKECPEVKKRKKKKMFSQPLNEPDLLRDITSEIVSPLPPVNKGEVNNFLKSESLTSEPVSCYKEESHQYDSNNAVKQNKSVKKRRRKNMDFGFKGSNLDSISGYGNL